MISPSRIASVLVVAAVTFSAISASAAESKKTYTLHSDRQSGAIDHVVTSVDIGGEMTASEDSQIKRQSMHFVANLTYDERTLAVSDGAKGPWRSVRYYSQAEGVMKADEGGFKPALGERRRLIGVKVDDSQGLLFSPAGPLTLEELDLIDVAGNTLLVDQLLPVKPVALSESWPVSDSVVAGLLGLDAVKKADVTCKLTEATEQTARFEIAGDVEGAACGVTAEIGLKGKFRFDRRSNRITWMGLLLRQKLDIGHVMQGLDGVARLEVAITPNAQSSQLTDAALRGLNLEPKKEQLALLFQPKQGDWQFLHDRRWNVNGAEHDLTILRFIDRGELVAQCNVSPLAKVKPGKQATLETFQKDIKQALGDQFGEFVAASQSANDRDYRVLQVVVRGLVSELPIQWHYYLVADKEGRQVAFAVTVEGKLVERLGNADKQLVGSLRFLDAKVAITEGSPGQVEER